MAADGGKIQLGNLGKKWDTNGYLLGKMRNSLGKKGSSKTLDFAV
jgi:hypothetical protein